MILSREVIATKLDQLSSYSKQKFINTFISAHNTYFDAKSTVSKFTDAESKGWIGIGVIAYQWRHIVAEEIINGNIDDNNLLQVLYDFLNAKTGTDTKSLKFFVLTEFFGLDKNQYTDAQATLLIETTLNVLDQILTPESQEQKATTDITIPVVSSIGSLNQDSSTPLVDTDHITEKLNNISQGQFKDKFIHCINSYPISRWGALTFSWRHPEATRIEATKASHDWKKDLYAFLNEDTGMNKLSLKLHVLAILLDLDKNNYNDDQAKSLIITTRSLLFSMIEEKTNININKLSF